MGRAKTNYKTLDRWHEGNQMNIHYETKTELVEKMTAIKIDINVADAKYQQALARGDFDTCGKYSNERAKLRNLFAKLLKYKFKRGWTDD